jgi:hypothetical protein
MQAILTVGGVINDVTAFSEAFYQVARSIAVIFNQQNMHATIITRIDYK